MATITNPSANFAAEIIDNGKGFDEKNNNIKDILTPYFTTKKKGTGLGLGFP